MALFDSLQQLRRNQKSLRRRRFLAISISAVGCLFTYRWWRARPKPLLQRTTHVITPAGEFFTTSINPAYRPRIVEDQFRLVVEGPGESRREYSLSEIRRLQSVRLQRTLVCVGNPVGGGAIGNAEWTATPLAPILGESLKGREQDQELHVVFHGLDGFYSSVPLEVAVHADSVLAYQMNGDPIPAKHGYPLRVLLPNRYGMKQPRWLHRILITQEDESGYWERRGWSDACLINSLARVDSVRKTANGAWLVSGIAFCGSAAVKSVEISFDDGKNWGTAELTSPATGNVWSTWQSPWKPEREGDYVLAVRVIDETGKLQAEDFSGSFPSGSTGIHRVVVSVT